MKEIESGMKEPRGYITATMINDDKLICIAGYDDNKAVNYVDLYDFNTKKWTILADKHKAAYLSGIYLSGINNRIYVCCGSDGYTVDGKIYESEYYDISQNKWIKLPNTNNKHGGRPAVWLENGNNLYIASALGNCIEKMDLRENKWNIIMGGDAKKSFDDLFGSKISEKNAKNTLVVPT